MHAKTIKAIYGTGLRSERLLKSIVSVLHEHTWFCQAAGDFNVSIDDEHTWFCQAAGDSMFLLSTDELGFAK